MISVGGAVVIGGEGAVTADAVSDALKQILGEEPAGTSIVADGAGDVGLTSADVAALLASADLAAFQSAVGVGARGSGTLAARPASPAAGDTYAVTSGAALGDRYACFVAGAWTLVVTDATAAGRAVLTAASAAAQRTAIHRRTVATSSLTAINGNGTANASTGALSYADDATSAAWADFPRLVGAHGGSVWALDAAVRVTMAGNPTANTVASISLGSTGSAYGAVVLWRVSGAGSVDAYDTTPSIVLAGTGPGTLPVDGTGWLRARVQGGVLTLWTGVGASYAAAAWTMRYRGLLAIPPSADSAYPSLALALYQGADPGPSGVSATFADLTLVDLS